MVRAGKKNINRCVVTSSKHDSRAKKAGFKEFLFS